MPLSASRRAAVARATTTSAPASSAAHVQPLDGADGEGRTVAGHAAGPGHLGPEVEERAATQHGLEPAVAGGVDHHEVEGAAAQVEYGYTDGGHRR